MLRQYIRTAIRQLARQRLFSLVNVLGLGLGFSAFLLIALYVFDEWRFDRFHEHADRIVRVVQHTRWNGNEIDEAVTSAPFAPALKAAFPEIGDAVRIDLEGGGLISAGDKKIKQEGIIFADKSFFHIFSHAFLYGHAATALSEPGSIVITETLARKLFTTAEKAYGQTMYIGSGNPLTVSGVIRDVPTTSHLRFAAVRPLPEDLHEGWQNFHFYTYLLLKKGVDRGTLEKKLGAFAAATIQQRMHVQDYRLELQPLPSIHLHSHLAYEISPNGSIGRVYLLAAVALLVLVIAVINYINLSTARATTRVKEIGVRKVIGSGEGHIIGMLLAEALLVACSAGIMALALVGGLLPWFNRFTGKNLSLGGPETMPLLFGFFALLLVSGLVAGIFPALFLVRVKTVPALQGLAGGQHRSGQLRKALVVFQFTVTGALISYSLLIYKQLHYADHADLGFDRDQVVTFHIDEGRVRQQVPALKARLLQSPLIRSVSAAGNPIGNNDLGGLAYRFETPEGDFSAPTVPAQELMADADFLPTMNIKLLAGRNFSETIGSDRYGAALINETLMHKLGWRDPLGKRMQFPIDDHGTMAERTVIGVIRDFHTYSLQYAIDPLVMVMPPSASTQDNIYVRLDPRQLSEGLGYLAKVYREFDPGNLAAYRFLDENFAAQYAMEKKQGGIALIFTLLAVFIACLGLFGLMAFAAVQRTREIGIRKVLGASVIGIVALLSGDFLKLITLSMLLSLPVAWLMMHGWLQHFAYRTEIAWWIFAATGLMMILVALGTVGLQALRAAMADPVKSLRTE